ncbi:hypothetical protein [Rhizobium sp. Root1204]|uniref:hypothetical protein n=1 Tax=Rhizobium sp. Root1204 TaxID=1736428 RepID=UPI0007141D42|nr:hypothetical protein [Rhizobium sp. Root1204]KQV38581.1 hypothetical protein ASC96_24855 [Rhizobium sp. Root1204]
MAHSLKLAELGTHFYKEHFGHQFVAADKESADTDWILFQDQFYDTGPLPLAGKSVAIVGNGLVTGQGHFIDSHDAVVRINFPYLWRRDPIEDGVKITHWVGLGKNEVFSPDKFHNPETGLNLISLNDHLLQAESFHCISHHHVQSGFWADVQRLGLANKLHVHFAAPLVFELIEPTPFGRDRYILEWITSRRYLDTGYGGWYGWDTLFSGVRIALLAALSKPKSINIFGMNFYTDGYRQPWDMHELDINKEVLYKVGHICREIGISFEILQNACS